jgi:hypothetical protein
LKSNIKIESLQNKVIYCRNHYIASNFIMKPDKTKYRVLPVFAVMAMVSILSSFTEKHLPSPGLDGREFQFNKSIFANNPVVYSPDTGLEADSLIIPLKPAGRLFLIDATIDDETGNLIFDTGAKGMVLNSTYFRKYKRTGEVSAKGVTGTVGTVEQITVGKIELAGLSFTNLTVEMANLGHIENRRDVKILGLLGFSMLKNYEIIFDPVHSDLKLFKIDKSGKRINPENKGFKPEYTQKIDGNSQILFLKCSIGGKQLNFCFDSAAETNVVNSESNKSILSTLTITRRSTLKGAGNSVSEVLFGRMNDFSLGGRQIGNMETIVANLYALSEAYNRPIDGILGYNFLKNAIVCVNFMNNQVGIRFVKEDEL